MTDTITAEIIAHHNHETGETELWPTAFIDCGVSLGFRCDDIAAAERVLKQIRKDPWAWVAMRTGQFTEVERCSGSLAKS